MSNTKRFLLGILMVGMLAVAATAGTFAYFTNSASTGNNIIKAGTLSINDLSGVQMVTVPANIFPGDTGNVGSFDVTTVGHAGKMTAELVNPSDDVANAFRNDLTITITNSATSDSFNLMTAGVVAPASQISSYIGAGNPQHMTVTYSYAPTATVQGGTFNFGIKFVVTQA